LSKGANACCQPAVSFCTFRGPLQQPLPRGAHLVSASWQGYLHPCTTNSGALCRCVSLIRFWSRTRCILVRCELQCTLKLLHASMPALVQTLLVVLYLAHCILVRCGLVWKLCARLRGAGDSLWWTLWWHCAWLTASWCGVGWSGSCVDFAEGPCAGACSSSTSQLTAFGCGVGSKCLLSAGTAA
jgi:hypothetical protein